MAYEHIDRWVEDYREGDAAYEVNRAFYPDPKSARQAIGLETALKVAKDMSKQFNDIVIMVAWSGRDDTEQLPVCLIYDKHLMFEVRFADLLDHIREG
jgi:hypothetical protein